MTISRLQHDIEHRAKEVCLSKEAYNEFIWQAHLLRGMPHPVVVVVWNRTGIQGQQVVLRPLVPELQFFFDAYSQKV